jgi:murein DD-endopeptidase MepM/ murein hydrolase activator NlpD
VRRLAIPFAVAVFTAAVLAAFSGRWPWRRPMLAATPITISQSWLTASDTLRRGETIGELFARQGLLSLDVGRLKDLGLDARRLRAGLVFNFRRAAGADEPSQVEVRTGPEERLRLEREEADTDWDLERETILWTHETVRIAGFIGSSLYASLDSAVPDEILHAGERMKLAWDLADVYAWSVDFTRDLQPGDRFATVIERRVSPEGEVRFGRVLAASLELSGKTQMAYRFAQAGREGFYDAEGASLRRAFLAAPVEFRRISSRFSRARFHPILRRYRMHAGTDYAASAGTPVMAAGDGTVSSAGWSGGYGLLVEIRHRNGVTTRYAHLRGLGRGIARGARVSQGETIGYVGSTGLATAAHLHYEFRVNGAPQDPRRVRIEEGPPIAPALRPAFDEQRDAYARMLRLPARSGIPSSD